MECIVNKYSILFMTLTLLLLTGCFITPKTYLFDANINGENYIIPNIKKSEIKNIGDTILVQGVKYKSSKITINSSSNYNAPRGEYYLLYEYKPWNAGNKEIYNKVYRYSLLEFDYGIILTHENKLYTAFVNTYGTIYTQYLIKSSDYTIDNEYYIEKKDNLVKTLVYTGKSGNTIKFLYREYYSDLVRQAFDIELSYDLKDGNIISCKGAKIQVHDVTNTSIKYTVISGFN